MSNAVGSSHGGIGEFVPPNIYASSITISAVTPRPYSCQKRYSQAETSVFSCFVYNKASAVARVSLSTTVLAYYVPDTSADLQGDSIRLDFGNFTGFRF